MAATCKVIELKGNPKNPESAEHIIKFPGGSIAVARTSNNEYWAHIRVHRGQIIEGTVEESAFGTVVDSRLDYEHPYDSAVDIFEAEYLEHIAIRIRIAR
jgi:hypothetical protein